VIPGWSALLVHLYCGLLAATVLVRVNFDKAAAIARDTWRRAHQTTAINSHYRR
jgi:hypothetical protein